MSAEVSLGGEVLYHDVPPPPPPPPEPEPEEEEEAPPPTMCGKLQDLYHSISTFNKICIAVILICIIVLVAVLSRPKAAVPIPAEPTYMPTYFPTYSPTMAPVINVTAVENGTVVEN